MKLMEKPLIIVILLLGFLVSGCKKEVPERFDLSWEKQSEDVYTAEVLHFGLVETIKEE